MSATSCSKVALDAIFDKVRQAIDKGNGSLAVVVLPGSFNPVHCEHVRALEFAKQHLEQRGVTVVGGFLQPSSDGYVTHKLGPEAISLEDRIHMCELAGQANGERNGGDLWVHVWRSGTTNGFKVSGIVERFLNDTLSEDGDTKLGAKIQAYMVCGADLVVRCGGWHRSPNTGGTGIVVLQRPGIELPTTNPAAGWELADGEMQAVSSTGIRKAIEDGDWSKLVDEGCESRVVDFMSDRHRQGTLFVEK